MPNSSDLPIVVLEDQLCFALYETSRAITKVYGTLLKDLELTYPQYLTMLILWEKDGLSVREIAERLGMEGATATPLIQRMERLGLVEKVRNAVDERRQDVRLTKKGRRLRALAADVPERLGCTLGISNDEAHALLFQLRKLREGMAEPEAA